MANRQRPVIVLAFCAGALLILMGYLIWSSHKEAIQNAETTSRNYAEIIKTRLDATLRRSEAHLQALARETPIDALTPANVPRFAREINEKLDLELLYFPELVGLRVINAGGDVIYNSGSAQAPPTSVLDRDYFRELRDNRQFDLVFSDVVTGKIVGRQILVMAKALRDADGGFRGCVIASIDLAYFQKIFSLLDVGPHGGVALYRSDNFKLVTRWPDVAERVNQTLPPDNFAVKVIQGGKDAATGTSPASIDGVTRIRSIQTLERYPFYVAVGLAEDDVLGGWRARSLLVGCAGLLFLSLLAGMRYRLWRSEVERNQFAAIVENSNDAIYSRSLDGTVLSWNAGAEKMLGYSAAEMIGRSVTKTRPDRPTNLAANNDALLRGESVLQESDRMTRDGRVVNVLVSHSPLRDKQGNIYGACVIMQDITERRRRASLLQLLELLARTTNQSKSPEEGLKTCAEHLCDYGGWQLGHVVLFSEGQPGGKAQISIWCGKDRNRFDRLIELSGDYSYNAKEGQFGALAIRERRPLWVSDFTQVQGSKDGRVKHFNEFGIRAGLVIPVFVGDEIAGCLEFFATVASEPDAMLLDAIDGVSSQLARLIERSRSEAELEKRVAQRTAELELANQELDSFSYTIAHDMRAPVRAINGFSEMMLKESRGSLDQKAINNLSRVVAGGQHLANLIDDLLEMARLSRQEVKRRDFNLSELAGGRDCVSGAGFS